MTRLAYEPFLVVVSAPSGTGKTTVCREAQKRLSNIRFSISHTTRAMRPGEVDGQDYFFVKSPADFQALEKNGAFLESANVYGNFYGTSQNEVKRARQDGVDLLVEIDVQGANQIIRKVAEAVTVFILPPSLEVVEQRLRGRASDHEDAIRRRLAEAGKELREASKYKYWIVNDNLEESVGDLVAIVRAERARRERVSLGGHPLASHLAA